MYNTIFEMNDHKETLKCWHPELEDVSLEVTYAIENGSIKILCVRDIATGLRKFGYGWMLKDLISHCESDQMRRNVAQQYRNYPHLATPQTREQQVEILKLK